jgi:hypothetical protein
LQRYQSAAIREGVNFRGFLACSLLAPRGYLKLNEMQPFPDSASVFPKSAPKDALPKP